MYSNHSEDLDSNWNPMRDAYNDRAFNSYQRGLGYKIGQQRNENKGDRRCKVSVQNISRDFTLAAFENLFANFGKPTDVKLYTKTASGLVEYATEQEALKAIKGLNRTEPHNMYVFIPHHKAEEKSACYVSEVVPQWQKKKGMGRGTKQLSENHLGPGKRASLPTSMQISAVVENDSRRVAFFEQNHFRAHVGSNQDEANRKILEQQQLDLRIGRRLSGGRGYTIPSSYTDRNENPKIGNSRKNPVHYTQKSNDFYECGEEPDLPPNFQRSGCAVCGMLCNLLCGMCSNTYYCSHDCQRNDWKKHKAKCLLSKQGQGPAAINATPPNGGAAPTTPAGTETKAKENAVPVGEVAPPTEPAFERERSPHDGRVLSDSTELNVTPPPNNTSLIKEQSPTRPTQAKRRAFFEIGERVKVDIPHSYLKSTYEYFVRKTNQAKDLDELQKELKVAVSDSSPSITPTLSAKCVIKYEGQWRRAQVISLNPLQVRFVDYGHVEACDPSNLKALPEKFCSISMFTAKVFIAGGLKQADLDAESFDIDVIKRENGMWVVEIVRDSCGATPSPAIGGKYQPIEMEKINKIDEQNRSNSESRHSHDQNWITNGQNQKTEPFSKDGEDCTETFPRRSGNTENTPVIITGRTETNSTSSPDAISSCNSDPAAEVFTCGEEVQVVVNHLVSKNEFWVSRIKDVAELLKLQADLSADVSASSPPALSVLDEMCAMKYEEEWCRARVVSLRPLKVLFIDYGNTENCTQADLKALPEKFNSVPPYACKVFLADGCLEEGEEENLVNIEVIKKSHIGGWIAKVIRKITKEEPPRGIAETYHQNVETPPSHKAVSNGPPVTEKAEFENGPLVTEKAELGKGPSRHESVSPSSGAKVIPLVAEPDPNRTLFNGEPDVRKSKVVGKTVIELAPGKTCVGLELKLEVTDVLSGQLITATAAMKDLTKELEELLDMSVETPYDHNYKPASGEMVAVNHNSGWARACVLFSSEATYCVALPDYSIVKNVQELKRLPAHLKDYTQLGVQVQLDSVPAQQIAVTDIYSAKCVGTTDKGWQVELKCINGKSSAGNGGWLTGELTAWSPQLEELGLPSLALPSGEMCIILMYHNATCVYVRPVTKESSELSDLVTQEIAALCLKAGPLEREPYIGEMVAAKWTVDGNFYRAQILKKEGSNYKVIFVDYGNGVSVSKTEMRLLPDSLKQVLCCAVRIGLKGVPGGTALTPAAQKYITKLSEEDIMLNVEYEDNLDAVTLRLQKYESTINEVLKELLEPSWVKLPVEETICAAIVEVVMRSDLPKQTHMDVGTVKRLLLLYIPLTYEGKAMFQQAMFCDVNSEVYTHVTGHMKKLMDRYCDDLPADDRYVPRKGELCVVVGEDGHPYRAECIKADDDSAFVAFIDFGSIVEVPYAQVHRIPPDLLITPPLGLYCYLEGLPTNPDVHKKIHEVMPIHCEYQVIVVGYEDEDYRVVVDEVNTKLRSLYS